MKVKKEKLPNLEMRRFESMYRTLAKMKPNERLRTLIFFNDKYRYNGKNKQEWQGK